MNSRMLLFALMGFSAWGTASAGWQDFVNRSMLDWHRNNAWPQPFENTDRLATCSPFIKMTEKGWMRQSTLSTYHFNPTTQQLTEAGHLKVRHITTQHPDGFNSVFVVRALKKEDSSIRLDSVQQSVARWLPAGPLPEVKLVGLEPPSMPAAEINILTKRREATVPDPRLPEFQSTTD